MSRDDGNDDRTILDQEMKKNGRYTPPQGDSLLFDFLSPECTPQWYAISCGLREGDHLTDEVLSIQEISRIGHSTEYASRWIQEHVLSSETAFDDPALQLANHTPAWLDVEAVVRGQTIFLKFFYAFFTLLIAILLNGFVISRFSEVLVLSGYARSARETYLRFRSTAVQIWLWMKYSLLDPLSPARVSLLQVRCMHGLARNVTRVRGAWNESIHFVPLSQFDTSLVLLGFSSILIDGMGKEMGIQLSQRDKTDLTHLWRYIGWHLGLKDEYSPCVNYATSQSMLAEFYQTILPYLTHNPRPSSLLLLRSAI